MELLADSGTIQLRFPEGTVAEGMGHESVVQLDPVQATMGKR